MSIGNILVVHNRASPEQRVDIASVNKAASDVWHALTRLGHRVSLRSIDLESLSQFCHNLTENPPALVFNLCESLEADARYESLLPTCLDKIGILYTGEQAHVLSLCLHKDCAKQTMMAFGVPTPPWVTLPREPSKRAADLQLIARAGLSYPLFIKPEREDGSVGISPDSVVMNDEALLRQIAKVREEHRQPVLCEQFIPGRELAVSVIRDECGNLQALPLTEINFSKLPTDRPRILCHESKWYPDSISYEGTVASGAAPIAPALESRIVRTAKAAARAVGIQHYGRCDIRLSDDGMPFVLEVNPNCDLSDGAGFSLAWKLGGLSYDALVGRIVSLAAERSHTDSYQKLRARLEAERT